MVSTEKKETVSFKIVFKATIGDAYTTATTILRKYYYIAGFVVETNWRNFDGKIRVDHIGTRSIQIVVIIEGTLPMDVFRLFHDNEEVLKISLLLKKNSIVIWVEILKYLNLLPERYTLTITRTMAGYFYIDI